MANTYIQLDDNYMLASSSVAVTSLRSLENYLNEVDKIVVAREINVPVQTSNWYIVQNPAKYFLASAFVVADSGAYYVTGFNMREGNTGQYTLFFNKTVAQPLQVCLIWIKTLGWI